MTAAVRQLAVDFSKLLLGRGSAPTMAQARHLSISPSLLDSIRDAHRAGTKITGAAKVDVVYTIFVSHLTLLIPN